LVNIGGCPSLNPRESLPSLWPPVIILSKPLKWSNYFGSSKFICVQLNYCEFLWCLF
jgi:hypothetical protein